MRAKRRRRITIQPRFFVILTLLVVLIATPVIILTVRNREYLVATSTVREELRTEAVIVRSETVVAARQTGQMQMLVSEGDHVEESRNVAHVYSVQYDPDALTDLSELRDDIITYQRNDILGDIYDADLAVLDAQIQETTDLIAQAVADEDAPQAKLLAAQLDTLISQREDYLRRNYRIDDTLSSMLEQEAELSDRIDAWTTDVQAPCAGLVSFYMDGCEHVLNSDMLDTLTAKTLQSSVQQASQRRVTQAAEYTSLFRVVDEQGFYIVLPMDPAMELVQGKSYTIEVEEAQRSYHATLLLSDQYRENGVHVFYVEDDPSAVLRLRDVHIGIEKEFEGLCISRRALYKSGGEYGVYVLVGDQKTFVPVTILAREGGRICVEGDALSIGTVVQLK